MTTVDLTHTLDLHAILDDKVPVELLDKLEGFTVSYDTTAEIDDEDCNVKSISIADFCRIVDGLRVRFELDDFELECAIGKAIFEESFHWALNDGIDAAVREYRGYLDHLKCDI